MANCKYCGQWAGIVGETTHLECIELAEQGLSNEEIAARVMAATASPRVVPPVTMKTIIGGVFWGNVFFALVAGALYICISIMGHS